MAVKFAIYSTDIAATLNPWNADPQPATMIDLGEDPIHGTCDINAGAKGRGARIPTLGGAVDQDYGSFAQDGQIKIGAQDSPVLAATISTLESAFSTVDGQYYFTDTVNCWKVKFAKPNGVLVWMNLFWKAQSQNVYSYEILLNVVSKDI